jgi:hypothetical protein
MPSSGQGAVSGATAAANTKVKGLLVELCELDDVSTAPMVLAPHLTSLLESNVTLSAVELVDELLEADLLPDSEAAQGRTSIAAAADFVLTYLEEFTELSAAMSSAHQRLLRTIVEAASSTKIARLDAVMCKHRHQLDSSFVVFLHDERKRLEGLPAAPETAPLLTLIQSIEVRVRSEIEAMTAEDARAVSGLLEHRTPKTQLEAARQIMAGRSQFEARRFIMFLDGIAAEVRSKKPPGSADLLVLCEMLLGSSGVLLGPGLVDGDL